MTRLRRQAINHLTIALGAALAVGSVYLATSSVRTSLAGFAVLALLGVEQLRAGRRTAIEDERDVAIQRRAVVLSYTVFWLCFVAWGVVVSLRFGARGAVPLEAIEPVVWSGAWVVIVVRAAATLIFDARGC